MSAQLKDGFVAHQPSDLFQHTFAKRPGEDVLEGRGVEEVHDLLLGERLLHHEAEEDDVAELAEVVEELGARVGVLHDVLQRRLVVPQHS